MCARVGMSTGKGVGFPRGGVMGRCELPEVGEGN